VQPWTIVIPVKGTRQAKSRFGSGDNSALAEAMALDTVEAAAQVARVIVVTARGEPFERLAEIVGDPGRGLNAAIGAGLAHATGNTAVLLGDVPSVRPAELAAALEAALRHPRAIVADADGTGTVLATATVGTAHRLAFGSGSRAAHVANGYIELDGDWPGLRRDIDTPEQLEGAANLGAHTRARRQEN